MIIKFKNILSLEEFGFFIFRVLFIRLALPKGDEGCQGRLEEQSRLLVFEVDAIQVRGCLLEQALIWSRALLW